METKSELPINEEAPSTHDANVATVQHVLKNGTKEKIFELLQQKIDSNYVSENGDTVLHMTLSNEKLIEKDIVNILTHFLAEGIDPNMKNTFEKTALHFAIDRRMKQVISLLIEYQADVSTVDKNDNSIAHFFIQDEYEKFKLAMFYPMMNTTENHEITEKCSVSFLDLLLSKKVDFDQKNKEGKSALHLAIKYYFPHILPSLFENTKDIMILDKNNETLLHLLLDRRSQLTDEHPSFSYDIKYAVRCIEVLLNKGVPVINTYLHGCNLVSKAIKEKQEHSIIEILINYYLKSHSDKKISRTLLHELMSTCSLWTSSESDYFWSVLRQLLIQVVSDSNEETLKTLELTKEEAKNMTLVQLVKEEGVDFFIRYRYGESPLHLLAKQNHYDGSDDEFNCHVRGLITNDALLLNVIDPQGKSALQTAVQHSNVRMVRQLINIGANVNHRDDFMRTPLHYAVQQLIDFYDNVNHTDNNESIPERDVLMNFIQNVYPRRFLNEPLQCAPRAMINSLGNPETEEVINLLLTSGADVNAKDCHGNVVLNYAIFYNNVALVRLLIKHGA